MFKKIGVIVTIAAILGFAYAMWKAGWFSTNTRVSVIEETPNIVEAVEQIQELCTEYYYDEVMVRDSVVKSGGSAAVANTVNSVGNWFSNVFSSGEKKNEQDNKSQILSKLEKELVVIVKVTCRVGYDLKEIVDNDGMQVCGDTLFITLPEPKFLETIANPTDINVFVEEGSWDFPSELQGAIRHAKGIVEQRAIADSIMQKADVSGRKILNSLFSTMGFKVFFTDDMPEELNAGQPSAPVMDEDEEAEEEAEEQSIQTPENTAPAA